MKHQTESADVTVIGGGLAGVCAAIAAARQGRSVNLIQSRPVLGGNSSSEIRVWVCGATAHGVQQYARETGIMGELWLENQFTNPDGNPYYWDLVVLEAVRREPHITLFLNTEVLEVRLADGGGPRRRIESVRAWMSGSERFIEFSSPVFCDCTGDGLPGFLAGADFRAGRESQSDFGESWAAVTPDDDSLGSTLLFYSKDLGRPVKFVPPTSAIDIAATSIPERRVIRVEDNGCDYWWIEWGGELDVVHDNEHIRDELHAVIYGIWDHIKNSGNFAADNLTLEWVGSVPGKREYRRFLGDHFLTQHDVLDQPDFDDRVAFGGWSIDLHPARGVYSSEPGSKHWHPDGNFHIPLRCLYSRNVENLWFAGRNISASHVAFGSTRVMATCAILGEAAGLGAALTLRYGVSPRELATSQVDRLQQALARTDASVLGLEDTDPDNLALNSRATASATLGNIDLDRPTGQVELDAAIGMILPIDGELDSIELLVDAAHDTELVIDAYRTRLPQNYLPGEKIATTFTHIPAGRKEWVKILLRLDRERPGNVFLRIAANPDLTLHHTDRTLPGLLFFQHRDPAPDEIWTEQFRTWKQLLLRQSLCLRVSDTTQIYRPNHVVGGYSRPYSGPNMWVSPPLSVDPRPWVAVTWNEPVTFTEVTLVMDAALEIDLINLHHHRTPFDVMPTLLKDYVVEAETTDGWIELARTHDNRHRLARHRLGRPVTARSVRVTVEETNGEQQAHLVSLRVYR